MRMPTNLDDSWIVQLVLRPLGFHLIAFFQIFKQGQPGSFFPLGPPASTGFVSRLFGGSGLGESFAFLEFLSHLEGGREGRREGGTEREDGEKGCIRFTGSLNGSLNKSFPRLFASATPPPSPNQSLPALPSSLCAHKATVLRQ
jgi:hypothetical protein